MTLWRRVGLGALAAAGLAALSAAGPTTKSAASATAPAPVTGRAARFAAFEAMARQEMKTDHAPGIAIALLDGNEVWAHAFGLADLEDGAPLKADSSFRLASVAKSMTAIAVLQLAEQGRLDLDAEIQTYVPYFPRKNFPVRVRQLLGHLGGITHYKDREKELHIQSHKTTREAIQIFADYDLVAEPGTKFNYSTYGFNLLGAAVEGASGQSYGDYMREHVWGPLAMKDTRLDDPRAIIPNRVRGYEWDDGRLRNSEFVDISSRFGGGGVRTTVLDLIRYARGILDGKLLSPASTRTMTQRMRTTDGRYTSYAMGWEVQPISGHYAIWHSGGQNETRTLLFLLPERHAAIAAATNFESGDLIWYVRALAAQAFGERWKLSGPGEYLPDRVGRAQAAVLRDAYGHGMLAFEREGHATNADPGALAAAFEYFRGCLNPGSWKSNPESQAKKRAAGIQPESGEALTVVGSYVAQVLAKTPGRLDRYHAAGPVPFFADYVAAYRRDPSIPRSLRLDSALEADLARWSKDWARTFNAQTRGPLVAVAAAAAPAGNTAGRLDAARLKASIAGASIYPDLADDLADLASVYTRAGDAKHALEAAELSVSIYPDSAAAVVTLAATQAAFGDLDAARASLAKEHGLDVGGEAASSSALNRAAYDLAGNGRLDAATAWLGLAIELYPKDANLYDSLGELEAKGGHTDRAIEAYRKALELDPKLESSAKALEKLEKPRP